MSRIYEALKRANVEVVPKLKEAQLEFDRPGTEQGRDPVSEAYQRLLQAIYTTLSHPGPKSLLVVSAVHGEGTSTVARQLAHLISADRSQRTLLVDANLRSPSQHVALHQERINGLTEIAAGQIEPEQAVVSDRASGLAFLNCGRPVGDPAAFLRSPALADGIQGLKAGVDWLVIDGPPVTPYPDALPLAGLTDGVILVMRADQTHWQVSDEARRRIEDGGGRILGGVLNGRRYYIPAAIYRRV